jgi:hypothetical protein
LPACVRPKTPACFATRRRDDARNVLGLTVWGGTQITTLRIVLAVVLEAGVVAYVAWAARQIGR